MTRVLLTVVALALLAFGCGSAENDPNLAAAASKTEDTGSSRFEISGMMADLDERFELTCSGEADYDTKRLRLTCDYGLPGSMELIVLGSDSYMRGEAYGFGASGDRWVRSTDGESFPEEFSPQRLLAMLRRASQSTEQIGEEQIRGEQTVRYRLVIDCEQSEFVSCERGTASVEVWIDGDGLVRRAAVDQESGDFAFEFFDFGADVVIEAPPAGEVVDIDEWAAPKSCEPDAGSPLTGGDVRAAMERQGLDLEDGGDCFAGTVATLQTRVPAAGDRGVAHCTVSRAAIDQSITFEIKGMQSAVVGNVQCAYTERFADAMSNVVADLERQARK